MSSNTWSGKTQGWKFGIKIFIWLIQKVGFLPAYILLLPVCLFYTIINPNAREAILQFRKHLGLKTNFLHYYAHFYSFALTLIHRTGIWAGKEQKYITRHEDRIEQALAHGKGVILLSAHIGDFWIAAEILKQRLNVPINILVLDVEDEQIKKIYDNSSQESRVNVIDIGQNPIDVAIKIKDALEKGEIVAALGDRYISNNSDQGRLGDENVSEVEFLGQNAKFPRGIFEMAYITQTPIIPVFMTRQSIERYLFRAGEIIEFEKVERAERKAFINKVMQDFVSQVAEQAKRTPTQWYNFYTFWDGERQSF